MIKFIDLFSGIGGFRLAFESVKAKHVFSADIDKYACETYRENFGNYPLCDVSKVDPKELPDFDILCGGFPCQPFSIAGVRKGFNDTRGTLFFDIERILREKSPKAFILENVKGLVNHNKGETMQVILSTLQNSLGYKVYHKVLNSKNYGLPQNRERIYIVGFKNKSAKFQFPDELGKKVYLDSILESNVEGHGISDIAQFNIINNQGKHKKSQIMKGENLLLAYEIRKSRVAFRYDGLSPTLTAKMGTGGNNVPVLVKDMRKLTTRECLRIQGFPDSFKIRHNNSQSYKQIGNSVSVPVVELVAKEILKALALTQ
jgi:DNA (cytosine-5)-methyltransferase 1